MVHYRSQLTCVSQLMSDIFHRSRYLMVLGFTVSNKNKGQYFVICYVQGDSWREHRTYDRNAGTAVYHQHKREETRRTWKPGPQDLSVFLFYLVIGALQMFFDDDDDDENNCPQGLRMIPHRSRSQCTIYCISDISGHRHLNQYDAARSCWRRQELRKQCNPAQPTSFYVLL